MARRRTHHEFESEGDLMYDMIKKAAVRAVLATNPVNVLYGTVEQESPLEIRVNEKLKLTSEFLDILEHLTPHTRVADISSTKVSEVMTSAGQGPHVHDITEVKLTDATIQFKDNLKKGDKVVLLRVQGGHRFLVIDRYVKG